MRPSGVVKVRLLWKLLAINIPVIGGVIAVVWIAINYLAADYFMVLMEKYEISPTETHEMFLHAVHRYLIWASLGALALAASLSFLLTRKVLRPLSEMAAASQALATGNYGARVRVTSRDEVGQLGEDFNRMAESLDRMEHLRKRMVADVAHELRTPLTNIRGYLEALRDSVVPPSAETYAIVEQEILRLVRLVEDLLQLARADAAGSHLERQDVSLAQVVEEVLDAYRPRLQAKGITPQVEIGADSERVLADRDKLLRMVSNLVDNAWRYTAPGGQLRLCAEREATGVKLTLANTGEGIAEEDLPFVFERFYRGDRSRSRESGGAGIGLAIVKELAEAHHGRVGAATGEGETRFWVVLPH
jgi:two-component system sensor histidine kinase BaeS